jgi:hypothetical protein
VYSVSGNTGTPLDFNYDGPSISQPLRINLKHLNLTLSQKFLLGFQVLNTRTSCQHFFCAGLMLSSSDQNCTVCAISSLTRTVLVDGQALASTLYVDVYSFTKDTNPGPFIKIISLFLFFWLDTPKRIGFERKTLLDSPLSIQY